MATAEAMLDEIHPTLPQPPHDDNAYKFGSIEKHNVVLACLPSGKTGVKSAAIVAENILRSFPSLRIGLMVGIAGGVPSVKNDIRLGDIVVSKPDKTEGGVIQYDFGKTIQQGRFERTGTLNSPPDALLGAVALLEAKHIREQHQIIENLTEMIQKFPKMREAHEYPGAQHDQLFDAAYDHDSSNNNCAECDSGRLVLRNSRNHNIPNIFYGLIASANQVMKHGATRDRLSEELGVLCFEMEAAGLMDRFPCLVIRGICDYADSHKNDMWQAYAAATSAAFAKELLSSIPPNEITKERPIQEIPATDSEAKYKLGLRLPENAPLIDDDSFVGRQSELSTLLTSLQPQVQSKSQRIVIVSGLGGVGKTQLTLAFAKRNQELFSAIFWLDSTSESLLKQSFISVADCIFGPKFTDKGEEDAVHKVRQWLSETGNHKWLLIFDNCDNQVPGLKDPCSYNLRAYFPYVSQGAILISTRNRYLSWGKRIQLKSLDDIEESLEILANRSERPDARYNRDAFELARRLDGLPLALATAGSYLNQHPETFEGYLRMHEDSWEELESNVEELEEYPSRTLFSTWNISYAHIQAQDSDAASLLQFLAYLDNQDIWFELLSKGEGQGHAWLDRLVKSRIRFNQAMKKLQDYSFVEMHSSTSTGGWSLHNCVHDWTLNHLSLDIKAELCLLALHCVGHCVTHEPKSKYGEINRRLLGHADRLQHKRLNIWTDSILNECQILDFDCIGHMYCYLRRLDEAVKIYQKALECSENTLGPDHVSTIQMTNNLGTLYSEQGKLDQGEEKLQQALKACEKILGSDHNLTLLTVDNLAALYSKQGKLDNAEKMHHQALNGVEKLYGFNHERTLLAVHHLGRIYYSQKKLKDAEKMHQRALEGFENLCGPDHQDTLLAVHHLGRVYFSQNKLKDAEKMHCRALEGFEELHESNHEDTLLAAHDLGWVFYKQGRLKDAEKIYRRVLEGFEELHDSNHEDVFLAANGLGCVYYAQGNQKDAEKMYQRAMEGFERLPGLDPVRVVRPKYNLALIYERSGRSLLAATYFRLAAEEYMRLLGDAHPHTFEAWAAVSRTSDQDMESDESDESDEL